MQRFEGTTAVITGGTGGIGRATALRLAEEGATVLVTGRDEQRLKEMGGHERVIAVANDSADADTGQQLRAAVDEHLGGRVDALFLNAGLGDFRPIGQSTVDEIDRQTGINVRGPLLHLGALDDALADGGSVVFNTSVANQLGMAGGAIYGATKGAVRSAMRSASTELAERGIRANAVSPGPIDTGFFGRTSVPDDQVEGMAQQLASQTRLGRRGSSEEIAAAVAFLLSSDASYVTGHELVVDGGMS